MLFHSSLCRVSLRKVTYTHGNVTERKAFTLNIPSETHIREADYFGMVSGRDVDKFSVTGLTPVKAEFVDAPYIKEFPLILECALIHTIEIGLHTQFIGEVKDVKVDESVLTDKKVPDIEKIRPCSLPRKVAPTMDRAAPRQGIFHWKRGVKALCAALADTRPLFLLW